MPPHRPCHLDRDVADTSAIGTVNDLRLDGQRLPAHSGHRDYAAAAVVGPR